MTPSKISQKIAAGKIELIDVVDIANEIKTWLAANPDRIDNDL